MVDQALHVLCIELAGDDGEAAFASRDDGVAWRNGKSTLGVIRLSAIKAECPF